MLKSKQTRWLQKSLLVCALLALILTIGCSERRKEAARLEAELEAHRRSGSADVAGNSVAETQDSTGTTDTTANSSVVDDSTVVEAESLVSNQPVKQTGNTEDTVSPASTITESPDSTLTVPESAKDSITMPTRPQDGYTVQIAGTRSSDEASGIVERFKLYGYDAYVAEVSRDGRPFYRVRIGRFETEQEAIALKNQLLEQQQVDGWVDQGTW